MTEPRKFERETEAASLKVRLIAEAAPASVVEIRDPFTGDWLATVFRIDSTFPTQIYPNSRHLGALDPRKKLLITAAEQFRSDIRNGKVQPCTE